MRHLEWEPRSSQIFSATHPPPGLPLLDGTFLFVCCQVISGVGCCWEGDQLWDCASPMGKTGKTCERLDSFL